MRILVLHVNRSGGTRLSNGLSRYFNVTHYPSPFRDYILNPPKDLSFYEINNNVLQDRIINHTYTELCNIVEVYDNVILLTRRNLEEAIQSWAYISTMRDDTKVKFGSHTTRYVWEKTDNYSEIEDLLTEADNTIRDLSSKYSIPLTYYEDLYYNYPKLTVESFNLGINFNSFKKYIDNSKRQRKYEGSTDLI